MITNSTIAPNMYITVIGIVSPITIKMLSGVIIQCDFLTALGKLFCEIYDVIKLELKI